FITSPTQVTFVLPLVISRRSKGEYGTLLTANVPRLAGGLGSVTQIDLTVSRQYSYRGQRRSFISASCPVPGGFTETIFTFAKGLFHFGGGETLETTLTRNCKVR